MFLTRQYPRFLRSAKILGKKTTFTEICKLPRPYKGCCNTHIVSRPVMTTNLLYSKQVNNDPESSLSTENKTETNKKPNFSSTDLLEKLIAGLSTDIHQKNRVYKNDLVRVINKVKEINFSTRKQGLLLIRCCTELLLDETSLTRMELVEEIWSAIKSHTNFDVEHYNQLLLVYIANNRTITASSFVTQMGPVKPNMTTYELIIRLLSEVGDINQCTEVISNMKSQNFPANEDIFNSLIICHGKAGNLPNINEILLMMKSLKIDKSVDTYTAVARALAWNKKRKLLLEELDRVQESGLQLEETHIMEIVKTLATVGTYETVPEVLQHLPAQTLNTPSISPYMQSVSTLLVFQNHPIVALEIYKCLPLPSFGPKDDQGLHGRSLVRDCVKASIPSSIIAFVTEELMSSGRNPIALHNASEAALQLGKVPLALDMFSRMSIMSMPVRPHYFWPLFIHSSKSYGEKGIMNTLSTMIKMDVKPDYDTIMEYCIPFVSFTSPQNLMKKFLDTGVTVSMVLTPMMVTLLNTGQVRAASEICELFEGKVKAERLLKPLLKGYLLNEDVKSTVFILEDILKKAADKNKDWPGRFLCVFMQHKRVMGDLSEFINLVKALRDANLKISTGSADYCISRLPDRYKLDTVEEFKQGLTDITDERLLDDGDLFMQQIPHPKQMNEESLRAHLNELEAKGMNTRGVLRKLLQQYCREGNLPAAREVADKCQREGVFLSAGMKAAIFDLYVKLGELDQAELALADLSKTSPNFTLDEFKVIDFATLMVYRKNIDRAFGLIQEQSRKRRIVGGRGIAMNCWRLLDATAVKYSAAETRKMFDTLVSLRYCTPTNAILGPLVRVHLKNNNLQEAVSEFLLISNKHNKTPLKHELLCHILKAMGDGGKSEDEFLINEKANGKLNKLAQTVLNVDKKVHGAGGVQLTLIAALAEVGYKKTLRKLLLDPAVKFHPDALLRRCERFADEKKVAPLQAIAECAKDLRHIDIDGMYELILDVCQRLDDCQTALKLWTKMQEIDVSPSQKFVKNICSLLKANNKAIPSELAVLLDRHDKAINSFA